MTDSDAMTLCCFLWAHDNRAAALTDYETRVLAFVADAGGEVVSRVATDGADGKPHEIQIFRFPSQHSFDTYMTDPRRTALAAERDLAIARTELFPVSLV